MISYNPLFETLDKKGIKLIAVERAIGISPAITAKFRKNERVSLETIVKICTYLDVPIEDVVEVIRNK